MNNYIIDASIVIQRFIQQEYTPQVRILFNRLLKGDRFYIPEFCLLECTNVIWKQVRFYGLPEEQAQLLIRDLQSIPFNVASVNHLLSSALDIGLTHQLAIYDSLYIALALQLDYPLITVDDRQLNAAINCGVTLIPITDFTE
ncbi:type II toxin-antitoxin system VapC family toxin [Capilliphycus salinus ALCB114379]|uniref:type II toxin-antitoxin system VapC family toxin n=1 Tax=Capilliphycus salinus TaxID=2768948 RepID=UPI0039A5F55C